MMARFRRTRKGRHNLENRASESPSREVVPTNTPSAMGINVCCYCGQASAVPPGATIVACPHCTGHNRVQGQDVERFASVSDAVTYRQDLEFALRASEASFLAAHADAGDADADAEALAAEDRALPCYVLPSAGGGSSSEEQEFVGTPNAEEAQTSWALRHGYATEC